VLEQREDALRRAGDEAGQAEREAAQALGMEAVDVLGRRDRELEFLRGQPAGSGIGGGSRTFGSSRNAASRSTPAGGLGGDAERAHHDAFGALLFLAREVDLGRGIVADQTSASVGTTRAAVRRRARGRAPASERGAEQATSGSMRSP
jgi:hypothetical protein